MKEFILRKGTLVKHGTTLCRLANILDTGLNNKGEYRDTNREQRELLPEISGIYVGNMISYFAAYAAYASEICPELHFEDYQIALNYYESSPEKFASLNIPDLPISLPVILNIRLGEDCVVYADEDFVGNGKIPIDEKIPEFTLIEEAETVWNNWQSGCLIRRDGIPANWIKDIEYPELSKLKSVNNPSKKLIADCDYFASGLKQSYKKIQPKPILKSLRKKHRVDKLSNTMRATSKNITELRSKIELSDRNNRLLNYFHILRTTEKFGRSYGIDFS